MKHAVKCDLRSKKKTSKTPKTQFYKIQIINVSAPPHCLQYHRGTRGAIKSFNYDEPGLLGMGYPNNMDYVICIRKEPGFCSITYQLSSEGRSVAPFAVGALPGAPNAAVGLTGPVAAECHDDYVLFTGIRVCSGRVSPTGAPNRPPNQAANGTSTYILTGKHITMKCQQSWH
ncbi:UNVERIFIED_CONTAM: hypothetical protein NCL1_28428 [Trichonephila clavipes]